MDWEFFYTWSASQKMSRRAATGDACLFVCLLGDLLMLNFYYGFKLSSCQYSSCQSARSDCQSAPQCSDDLSQPHAPIVSSLRSIPMTCVPAARSDCQSAPQCSNDLCPSPTLRSPVRSAVFRWCVPADHLNQLP